MSRYRDSGQALEFVRVADADEVKPGRMKVVEVDDRELVLVNLDGELFALDNSCPHNGGPLAQGSLRARDGQVVCPWHSWSWDVRSGRAVSPPVGYQSACYEVRVEGPDVLVCRTPR